jgi:hypothetical protein
MLGVVVSLQRSSWKHKEQLCSEDEKDEVWRTEKDYTSGVSITAGIQIKTSHALCLMRCAQRGKFVEKL